MLSQYLQSTQLNRVNPNQLSIVVCQLPIVVLGKMMSSFFELETHISIDETNSDFTGSKTLLTHSKAEESFGFFRPDSASDIFALDLKTRLDDIERISHGLCD